MMTDGRWGVLVSGLAAACAPAPAPPPAAEVGVVVLSVAEEPSSRPTTSPAPRAASAEAPPTTRSCTEASAAFLGEPSRGRNASILNRGDYVRTCNVPATTRVEVCVASGDGQIQGMDVVTRPPSEALNTCLTDEIRTLTFPSEPGLDLTRAVFVEI